MPALPVVIAEYSRGHGPFETALRLRSFVCAQDDNWFAFEMTINTGARSEAEFSTRRIIPHRFLTRRSRRLRHADMGRNVLRPYIIVWRKLSDCEALT